MPIKLSDRWAKSKPIPKLKSNQILLTFKDKDTADYVRLVCRRKGISLDEYILGNFEWDDTLYCLIEGGNITADTCDGCDYADRCPDVVKV